MAGSDRSVSGSDTSAAACAAAAANRPFSHFGPTVWHGWKLMVVHDGVFDLYVDERRQVVSAGQVALLAPDQRVYMEFSRHGSVHDCCQVLRPALPGTVLVALRAAAPLLSASSTMQRLLQAAVSHCASHGPVDTLNAITTAALALYAAEARALDGGLAGGTASTVPHHSAVVAAREFIRLHLGESIQVPDIAVAVHVAPEYLARLFQRDLGVSPVRYLWLERIRRGVELLEQSDLPVCEIATRTGFATSQHFARRVRAATGMPPSGLRKRHAAAPVQQSLLGT